MKQVEQLNKQGDLLQNYDTLLTTKEIRGLLTTLLGESLHFEDIDGHRNTPVYLRDDGKRIILLTRCITYLGHPHPIFKKRIQLPRYFKEIALKHRDDLTTDVRYLGVYAYQDVRLLVDFDTRKYIHGKSHNSSAHVYTNDLYQGLRLGFFQKEDAKGNLICVLASERLKQHLEGRDIQTSPALEAFHQFNQQFVFNQELTAQEAITQMKTNRWGHWRQAEWAGWFLEYKLDAFLKENNLQGIIRYTGTVLKRDNDLDFDLYFPEEAFQGDLKATDINKKESPGNDQENLMRSLAKYGRFWYALYEHQTVKDLDIPGHPATCFRLKLLKEDGGKDKKEDSYLQKMKYSVNFQRMMIIEVNPTNAPHILKNFHQGHQPDGSKRKPKFLINKRNIDNFVIYRYTKKEAHGEERTGAPGPSG